MAPPAILPAKPRKVRVVFDCTAKVQGTLLIDQLLSGRDLTNSLVGVHHFADASRIAYGTVSYIRLTNYEGKLHCAFLFGKSRLADVKPMTIPRLELCAAVVAVQVDQMLRKELELNLEESVFWTDSMSVLQYIRNESTRFHTFVASRLAIIHNGLVPLEVYEHTS